MSRGTVRCSAAVGSEGLRAQPRRHLIGTSDDTLTAEIVALGYKQWAEIERAWRDRKSGLDLWPMDHRKSDRIRAHVLLCWLALLRTRVVEVRTGETWSRVHQERSDGRPPAAGQGGAMRRDRSSPPGRAWSRRR